MVENPNNQPRPYDVVLGGNNPPPAMDNGSVGLPSSKPQDKEVRVPVFDSNGTPAAPTQLSKARRWLEIGKAREVSKNGVFSVQLIEKASPPYNQSISVDTDSAPPDVQPKSQTTTSSTVPTTPTNHQISLVESFGSAVVNVLKGLLWVLAVVGVLAAMGWGVVWFWWIIPIYLFGRLWHWAGKEGNGGCVSWLVWLFLVFAAASVFI
jgi:hypothetical protein